MTDHFRIVNHRFRACKPCCCVRSAGGATYILLESASEIAKAIRHFLKEKHVMDVPSELTRAIQW